MLPSWKGNVNLSYANGGWYGSFNTRMRQGFKECENNSCQQPDASAPPPRTRNVSGYFAADLNLGYKLSHSGGSVTNYSFGINNVFDATPPYIVNGFTAASDGTAYDYMGRYFYLRLSHEIK